MAVEAVSKSIITAILAGGMLIASFYFAYVLLLLVVLGGVGFIAYLFFNYDELFKDKEYRD